MSLAFEHSTSVRREVAVVRAGVLAQDICRRGGRGEVAALFERSLYLRVGDAFICIGEPAIGNGPTTLIVDARVATLGLRPGQRAFISNGRIAVGGVLFDSSDCTTWRAPPWPIACAPLPATCAKIAQRAATESPADSLARAAFGADDAALTRIARPRIAKFEAWFSGALSSAHCPRSWTETEPRAPSLPPRAQASGGEGGERSEPGGGNFLAPNLLKEPPTPDPSAPRCAWGEGNPTACASGLIGLGPGLTPSGDDFLIGALAMLDALEQTNIHAALGAAVVASAGRTLPLSASFLRAAAAGHVGENLHAMVAAVLIGDADAAVAAAARIGHTSGWDMLAGALVTARNADD